MVTRKKVTTTRPETKPNTKAKEQHQSKQEPQRPLGVGKSS